ncbi:MAG: DUF6618 family protein [Acetivibrio ethanolgignens]
MEYMCTDQTGNQLTKWKGKIHLLRREGNSYELEINGRGTYFHAIVGRHRSGHFICIPNHDVGCELSDYSDVFWNRERLSGQLKNTDAVTVACALQHLKEL